MDSPQPAATEEPSALNTITKSWVSRSRAWISILILTPVGILVALSAPRFAPSGWAALGFEALGWCLFIAGATLRWWATLFIGGRKGHELMCEGPYSITRNPLYFGTFLIVFSIAVLIQSLTFALAIVVSTVFYLAVTVPREERRLLHRHGEAFESYRNRVPLFFPRVRLYHSPEEIVVREEGLRAELTRSLRWIWVPFLCHVFIHVRAQPWWFKLPFDLP